MEENKRVTKDVMTLKEIIKDSKEWFFYVLSKWKIILIAGFTGAILGLTYSVLKKPIYTATLSFALEDEKGGGGFGSALGLASSFGFDLGVNGGSIFTGSNLAELLKSRAMVEKTLLTDITYNNKKISLAELYIQDQDWREKWKDKPSLAKLQFLPKIKRTAFTRVQDSILGSIYEALSEESLSVLQRDKKISIININVSSENELFSKFFCEALVKEVSKFYVETKSKKAKENMRILVRQTDSIRRELNSAITGVALANDNTFNLNPALNVRRVPSARRQVDVQANTAILTELIKQSELAKVSLRKETPLIQIIDRPILPLKKDRFGKAKGIVIGGFLAGLLMLLGLVLKRILDINYK